MQEADHAPEENGQHGAIQRRCCPHLLTQIHHVPTEALEEWLTPPECGVRTRYKNGGVRPPHLARSRLNGTIQIVDPAFPRPRFTGSGILRAASAQLYQHAASEGRSDLLCVKDSVCRLVVINADDHDRARTNCHRSALSQNHSLANE